VLLVLLVLPTSAARGAGMLVLAVELLVVILVQLLLVLAVVVVLVLILVLLVQLVASAIVATSGDFGATSSAGS